MLWGLVTVTFYAPVRPTTLSASVSQRVMGSSMKYVDRITTLSAPGSRLAVEAFDNDFLNPAKARRDGRSTPIHMMSSDLRLSRR